MIAVFIVVGIVAAVAIAAMAYSNRTDVDVESGISSFRRELDALAPRGEPRSGRVSHPDGSRPGDGSSEPPPSINGPASGRVTILPSGTGATDDDTGAADGGAEDDVDASTASEDDRPRRRRRRPAPDLPAGLVDGDASDDDADWHDRDDATADGDNEDGVTDGA